MRFIVLLFLAICGVSAVKVALLRWKAKPPIPQQSSTWEATGRLRAYPTAQLTRWDHLVYSPYREDTVLDVRGHQPGDLMLCGASRRPFYVPLRHDLHYGDIVGQWVVKRSDLQGETVYHLRFITELQGVSAKGRRVKSAGRALPKLEQSEVELKGRFRGDQLVCQYEERFPGEAPQEGIFRWSFSSAQDVLHGVAEAPEGMIDSQGNRVAGSRGNIPASGRTAEDFVPANWKLLDQVAGGLDGMASKDAGFLALVLEEAGFQPLRWLVLAHREYGRGDYQTILITPRACQMAPSSGEEDPFRGLSLPRESPRGGVFAIRHHAARDHLHAGLDLWFQFDRVSKEWRLSEGRRYRFDLRESQVSPEKSSVVPGTPLAVFDIEDIAFGDFTPSERPTREITWRPALPTAGLGPFEQGPMPQVHTR